MTQIFNLINDYWFWFVLAGIFLYFIVRFTNLWTSILKRKLIDNNYDYIEKNLTRHDFFSQMDYHINIRIPSLPIINKFKKKVFTDFLIIKYSAFRDAIYSFVERQDLEILSKDQLSSEFKKLFNDTVKLYNIKAQQEWIPQLVIDKFMIWHKSTIEKTSKEIWEFCQSDFFYSNTSRISAILTVYNIDFYNTIIDAEKTLKDINWDLAWLEYKWIICEKDKH